MGSLSPIARLGDPSDHGGVIISASTVVTCDGIGVARQGDLHACPMPGHDITPISSDSCHTVDGRAIVRVGDVAGCGAVIIEGSPVSKSQ